MAIYTIEEQTIQGIADAIRGKIGSTKIVQILSKESKTPDAVNFEELGSTEGGHRYDVVTLEGASSIKVSYSVLTYGNPASTNAQRLEIAPGNLTEMPSDCIKLGGSAVIKTGELLFENTDTITFHFYIPSSLMAGYYAICVALDSEGNPIEGEGVYTAEVPLLLTSAEMPAAIDSIESRDADCNGMHIPDEALTVTGNCTYKFANDSMNWLIRETKGKLTTYNMTNVESMFSGSKELEEIPFELSMNRNITSFQALFENCYKIKELPRITFVGNVSIPTSYTNFINVTKIFNNCHSLREIPEDYLTSIVPEGYWEAKEKLNGQGKQGAVAGCNSLRRHPKNFLPYMNFGNTYYFYSMYQNMFIYCYALDEIVDLPVETGEYSSNAFASMTIHCNRIKNFTFEVNENGSPKTAKWKSQTIDLTSYVGQAPVKEQVINTNSGITADKEVKDDATYHALKDDPDWFTCNFEYNRYNKTSAINTINSLPDTSAYLATAGGTNTIKFQGACGSKTDGGAINTMTEEEIAVAASKGWTVTFA